jgi:hypothetical protein
MIMIFHAEISDAFQRRLRMIFLKPRGRFRCLALGLEQAVNVFAKGRIGQHAFKFIFGDSLQNYPGILRELPQ